MGTFEKFVRKNWLIYYLIRTIYEYFLSNLFFESDCKVFAFLNKKKNLKIVDIGSSNGVFSRYIAKYLYASKFYCFEPLFFLHKQLKISKNKNKSILIKKGCGERSKKILIYTPYVQIFKIKLYFKFFSSIDKSFAAKNLFFYFRKKNFKYKKTQITIRTLDSFNLKPDIIKIDTENYEFNIILGAIKTIKKNRPIIMIENPSKQINILLNKLGFEKYQYLKNKYKLKKVQRNNKNTYNYFFVCKKKGLSKLFKF